MRNVIGNEALRFEFLRDSRWLSDAEQKRYDQLTRISDDMSDAILVEKSVWQ